MGRCQPFPEMMTGEGGNLDEMKGSHRVSSTDLNKCI